MINVSKASLARCCNAVKEGEPLALKLCGRREKKKTPSYLSSLQD